MRYFLLSYFNNKPLYVSSSLGVQHQENQLCRDSNWYSQHNASCWFILYWFAHDIKLFLKLLLEIFTICFREVLVNCLDAYTLRGDTIQWQFSEDKLHFLLSIVFYCNTSVGHCRFSLLLASGGLCSWLTCSFECPVRFCRYLFVILLISPSTNGILEYSWSVLLLTYRGALNTIPSIFDYTLCMIFVFDGLAQPQSCIP
jgi:hypothetical protein